MDIGKILKQQDISAQLPCQSEISRQPAFARHQAPGGSNNPYPGLLFFSTYNILLYILCTLLARTSKKCTQIR